MLSSAVLSFAVAALVSVAYRNATPAFADSSIAFLATLALLTAAPAAIAAAAPRNFWLRAIYAGLLAGLFLGARRVLLQSGVDLSLIDENLALIATSLLTFVLALGAPLWRAAIGFSLIGLAAVVLGACAGLAAIALETANLSVSGAVGASIAVAAGLGAALSVQISAAFTRSFAEGGDNFTAAASAARHGAAPALFSLALAVGSAALGAFSAGADLSSILASSRIAAIAAASCLAAPLFMLAGAQAMKAKTEMTAVIENRRRTSLRPFLSSIRAVLPPSSAIAASAIFLIAAIVAAFETKTPASVGEVALISVVAVAAALIFVSLRTALMAAVLVAAAGRIAVWTLDLAGAAPPTEIARVAAAAIAAALSAQLFLAWRDRRNPRRKTREVVQMALGDSLFAYIAASALAIGAVAASEVAGLWSEGIEAALYTGLLSAIGLVAGPPLMTAIGALFGRD